MKNTRESSGFTSRFEVNSHDGNFEMLAEKLTVSELAGRFKQALAELYAPKEISQLLAFTFEELLQLSRTDQIIKANQVLTSAQVGAIMAVVEGLKEEVPIQYLIGFAPFYNLRLRVTPDVLIPRPETEELVRWIVRDSPPSNANIIDLGTGSGCIALALKASLQYCKVSAVDVSIAALNIAQENAVSNNLNLDFFLFDILQQESLGFMEFDVMVSNPPYVTKEDREQMTRNVVDHEPHSALFVPEDDPLVFYRRIVDLADGHLKKEGKLYFEINERFGKEIVVLLKDHGYGDVILRKDLNGRDRMARATKN